MPNPLSLLRQDPLRLSLSQSYVLRLEGITYKLEGVLIDPRPLFAVQFQVVSVDTATDSFDTWIAGLWETNPPGGGGPYAATIKVGAGQPAQVNPAAAGRYTLYVRYFAASETPAFPAAPIEFTVP